MALQGVTLGPHRVQVTLNDVDVGEVTFDGSVHRHGDATALAIAPVGRDEPGQAHGSSRRAADISLVDYLRMTYWRRYTADQNILWLTASGSPPGDDRRLQPA